MNNKSFTRLNFSSKNFGGFTLIELLVVIAVIGVISSIILVSMKGTRGKARITTGMQFSQTINHTLGAYAVGIWSFNEGGGGIANDWSGYANHGTIVGATYVGGPAGGDNDTPYHVLGQKEGKYALSFNAASDYVNCGQGTSLELEMLTIEYWIKPPTGGDSSWRYTHIRKLGGPGRPYWTYGRVGSNFTFEMRPDDNSYHILSTTGISWDSAKWYHLAWTYDNDTGLWQVFVNGVQNNDKTDKITLCTGTGVLRIGGPDLFNGAIDEVRIYERALSAVQIQQRYVESAPTYGIALK